MSTRMERHKRYIFMAIIIIVLGISFSTTLKESVGALGLVFIALGTLFLIIGIRLKSKDEEKN